MNRIAIAVVALAVATPLDVVLGQTLSARRMAMGGVVLPSRAGSGEAYNVAYRAVPAAPRASAGLPLPIGLIPVIADPPTLDPDDPDFNVYELANTLYNPPWNLQLVTPPAPSSDVVVELGRNHLAVHLGEIAGLFPEDGSRIGGVTRAPGLGVGIGRYFVGVSALVDYANHLRMNEALHAVLADGRPFRTNTEYSLFDDARGQAAAGLQAGWAGAVAGTGDPRAAGGSALYAGARARLLRGLAYADARNVVAFATRDTLFSAAPIDLHYTGDIRSAGPDGGGWGRGLDLGLVWLAGDFEAGFGLNDIATRIDWRVEESVVRRDTVTGDYARAVLREDSPFTSEIPQTVTANAARAFGSVLVAADVVRSGGLTRGHLGMEAWRGRWALRSGASLDADRQVQVAGGFGLHLGRMGVDLALATHSRNVTRERGLELAAGLSFYR